MSQPGIFTKAAFEIDTETSEDSDYQELEKIIHSPVKKTSRSKPAPQSPAATTPLQSPNIKPPSNQKTNQIIERSIAISKKMANADKGNAPNNSPIEKSAPRIVEPSLAAPPTGISRLKDLNLAAETSEIRVKKPRKPRQPRVKTPAEPLPADINPELKCDIKEGINDLMNLPIELLQMELVKRGYHEGVIKKLPQWYLVAMLRDPTTNGTDTTLFDSVVPSTSKRIFTDDAESEMKKIESQPQNKGHKNEARDENYNPEEFAKNI